MRRTLTDAPSGSDNSPLPKISVRGSGWLASVTIPTVPKLLVQCVAIRVAEKIVPGE
jgi:hypothetical protein